MTVLVGGISELFQSDLDLGRLAVERLIHEQLGAEVVVEELHYGAVAVAQRLEDLNPRAMVLISAVRRGRPVGAVERRRVDPPQLSPAQVQAAVGDAVTGYVHIDLLVEIATGFGVLPPRTVAVEVEPESTGSGEGLSLAAAAGLDEALVLVRHEVRRLPLLALADQLGPLVHTNRLEQSSALDTVRALLQELTHLDREGRWGHTFALRDRLRLTITAGQTPENMDHQDWGLWWALIEELDRLQAQEALAS